MFVPRAAADVLQERQGQDGDVRHAGAGQLPQQGVRPRGQRVPAGARHHAQVGGCDIISICIYGADRNKESPNATI